MVWPPRETSRDGPPFTMVHAVASHLSLPETTLGRFRPSLQQGIYIYIYIKEAKSVTGRLPPNLNLEPLDV